MTAQSESPNGDASRTLDAPNRQRAVLQTLVFLSLPPLSAVLVKWAGLSGRGTFLYEALLLACLGVFLPHGLKSLFVTPLLAVTLAAIGLAKAGVDVSAGAKLTHIVD